MLPSPLKGSLDLTHAHQGSGEDPLTSQRHRWAIWPWAWLALEVVATIGWLLAIGWIAVKFVVWLWG